VILLEVDAVSVAVFELERDAPRSVDVDSVGLKPLLGLPPFSSMNSPDINGVAED
jgi:hypothetical protein